MLLKVYLNLYGEVRYCKILQTEQENVADEKLMK